MGEYDQMINRSGASVLLPEENSIEIIQSLPTSSFCMRLMKKGSNMNAQTFRMPVMSMFPRAYWVGEKTTASRTSANVKKTTKMTWDGVYIYAEEMAAIVPVPENVLDDMLSQKYDLWGEVKPRLVEAIGACWDSTVLFGVDPLGNAKPATFPDGIVPTAIARSNSVAVGDYGTDLYDDLLSVSEDGTKKGLLPLVEEDGFISTGALGGIPMMGMLRGIRSQEGVPIFVNDMKTANDFRLAGMPLSFPNNGSFDPTTALLVVGDWSQAVYAVRTDIRFKIATEASIHDASGNLEHNLFQDDMVALRVTWRGGWAVPNPINLVNPDRDVAFPFGVLTPKAAA